MAELTSTQIEKLLNSPDFTLTSKASYEGRVLRLYCKQYENGAEANSSTIHWMVRAEGGVVNWYGTGPTTVMVGSTAVLDNYGRVSPSAVFPAGKNTYKSGSFTVNHKSDGTIDALPMSISTAIYWGAWNTQTTDAISWPLRKIDRYFSKAPEVQISTTAETSITVTYSTSETASTISAVEKNGKSFSYSVDTTNKRITFSNLTPGEKYNFKISFTRADSGMVTTVEISPSTYYYPYIQRITNSVVYPGEDIGAIIYNPRNLSVTIYMGIVNNDTSSSSVIVSKTTTAHNSEILLEPTEENIYAKLPIATSAKVYYYCKTSGGNNSQQTCSGKISIKGTEIPSVPSSYDWIDGNSTVSAITGQGSTWSTTNWMVQNLSELTTRMSTGATAATGTTIKSYTFKIGNIEKTIQASSSAGVYEINWGKLNFTGAQDFTIIATDQRGLTNSVTKQITFYPYKQPSASITAERVNNYGTNVNINYGYEYSKLNGKNGIKLYYKKTQNGTTSTSYLYGSSTSFATVSAEKGTASKALTGISNDYGATFTIYIQDKFGSVILADQAKIERGQPILFVDEEQSGVGVGCFPTGQGLHASRFSIGGRIEIVYDETLNAIVFRSI